MKASLKSLPSSLKRAETVAGLVKQDRARSLGQITQAGAPWSASRLQRTLGNRAVGWMIQAKLEIGQPRGCFTNWKRIAWQMG